MGASIADCAKLSADIKHGHLVAGVVRDSAGTRRQVRSVSYLLPRGLDRWCAQLLACRGQRIERLFEAHRNAAENRRVPQCVEAGLGLAKLHYQIEEISGFFRLER